MTLKKLKKNLLGFILGLMGFFGSIILSPLLLIVVIYFITTMCFEVGYYNEKYIYNEDETENIDNNAWED